MIFDRHDYVQTLRWLGEPRAAGAVAWIERPVAEGGWDARGSWPYGSLPDTALVDALCHRGEEPGCARSLLTWTGVIRPDGAAAPSVACRLETIAERRPVHCRVLKDHLAHLPDRPCARAGYSSRTRRRLQEARGVFDVIAGPIRGHAAALAGWQETVRRARGIPRASSPDAEHFAGLERLGGGVATDVCLIALHRRHDRALCGGLVAVRGDDSPVWHAHSALCDAEARRGFGAYLLFDTALDVFGDGPIWWGGQPSGSGGPGVWRFKQRFANHSAPVHLACIELDPDGLRAIRSKMPRTSWLPDYRDPAAEMAT